MSNTLSHKVAALTIGSLLTFSTVAFASTYKTEAVSHTKGLGNSEILVAQVVSLKNTPVFSKSVAAAETSLGNALAAANSDAIGGSGKSALARSIAKATSLLGNATASSGSNAVSDKKAVASSLSQAVTVLGDALAIAQSNAISGPGKPAIAKSLATAQTAVGNATAVAQSSAQSGR